jgi:hypothetical protein
MRRLYIAVTVGIVVVFLSGVGVGQLTQVSKFAEYRSPANVTRLELMLMQADMMELRESVGYGKNGIAPARFFFNPKTEKITAFVTVDGPLLGTQPSGSVKEKLSRTGERIFTELRISIPELSERNFEVEFKNLEGSGAVDFGEYKDGKLILQ